MVMRSTLEAEIERLTTLLSEEKKRNAEREGEFCKINAELHKEIQRRGVYAVLATATLHLFKGPCLIRGDDDPGPHQGCHCHACLVGMTLEQRPTASIPTLRSQEIGWQYTRAESGHVLWTCRRCKRQAWSPGTQPVACACDFRCCGASDPPCTDFDGSCKNPANYPPAKPAADEYTPGCNFPRCVCPDGKECSK
jgi:hypothetical protein